MDSSDRELVLRIKSGDVLAFEVLVNKYQRSLYGFTNRIVKDDSATEDIVQKTFFKIYKSIDRVDPDRRFSTYAFEIAKNTAISYLRTLRRQIPIDQIEIELADSTFDSLFKENQEKRVSQAIKSLPKKYQKVIRLYYFSDLSYKDIGEELKLPVNTIRTHLRRAKESLKNTLKVYEER